MKILGGKVPEFNGNVRDFAKTGVSKVVLSTSLKDEKKIGDKFLAAIEEKGGAKEKEIAHFARLAAKKTKSPQKIQLVALEVLAREVDAPVSNILAGIGTRVIRRERKTGKDKDIGKVIKVFLKGVEKNAANPTEKALVRTASNAASIKELQDEDKSSIQLSVLETIEKGVGKDSIGTALAKEGNKRMYFINDYKEGGLIGKAFLKGIRDKSDNLSERRLAEAALNVNIKKYHVHVGILKSNDHKRFIINKTALSIIKNEEVDKSPERTLEKFNDEAVGHLIQDKTYLL